MHYLVCIKQVPDTSVVKLDPKTNTLDRSSAPSILNPYDAHAVEEAVRLKTKYGGKITVLTMGPPMATAVIKKSIEMGADEGILITDRAFAGADTLATSYALTQAIEKLSKDEHEPVDIIFAGKQAIDGDTAQVGPGIARRLGVPVLAQVSEINNFNLDEKTITVRRNIEQGYEILQSKLPCLITVEKDINELTYSSLPNMMIAARYEPIMWTVKDMKDIDITQLGLKGSPTVVGKIFAPPKQSGGEKITGSPQEVVNQVMDRLRNHFPANKFLSPESAKKINEKADENVEVKEEQVSQINSESKTEVEKSENKVVRENTEYQGVFVFIEQRNGKIATVSLELLGEGRKLADKLGVELSGVLLGNNVKELAKTCFEYGAENVYLADNPIFDQYRSEAYQAGVVEIVNKYKPEILLFGATVIGRDLASTVATSIGTGLTADTTKLDINSKTYLLEASRPAMGGNIMATILCKERRPQMASVRPKVMKAMEPVSGRTGKLIEEDIKIDESNLNTKVIEVVQEVSNKIDLGSADIVVAGGKGMKDENGFQLIRDLAEVLDAGVGASRDAVEAGWIMHPNQVGQTGITVAPKLYFAIGISGAVQHTVGMENSEVVVAINKNPDAQIFERCTYGIVGDAFEIVPIFIEEFKKYAQKSGEVNNG